MADSCDIVIVGAGIIGLTTALNLLERQPGLSIVMLEKEADIARHQTGHNSGVIHAGLYYAPGSLKAKMCLEGRERLMQFCDEQSIAYEVCGKVVVATEPFELPRLDALTERARANGVAVTRLDRARLRELEPHAEGIAGLHVPSTGIVNYVQVCEALRRVLIEKGVEIRTASPALSITERSGGNTERSGGNTERSGGNTERSGMVDVVVPGGVVRAGLLVNCAGLHSDRIARMAGADTGGIRIMPFRGEYFELVDSRRSLCRNLIYPLPDPAFPFLGVHLTRMIDGSIHAGPNAVPALAREGYTWKAINGRDIAEVLRAPRTYRLAKKYWRTGAGEIRRSVSKRAFTKALQRLCPEIVGDDLVPSHAGVRAQALDRTGKLVDDFAFAETAHGVHVVNAPSPAATASFAIGGHIATRVLAHRLASE